MQFSDSFKLINYSTIITGLHQKYGPEYFFSQEFQRAVSPLVNSKENILKFLFLIAYEIQDAYSETIADEQGIANKLLELLEANKPEEGDNNALHNFYYYMAVSFINQYGIFVSKDDWVGYAKTHNKSGEVLKEEITSGIWKLKRALEALFKCPRLTDNTILDEIYSFERWQLVGILRGYLQEDRTPDISSVVLFSDQFDSPILWADLAELTFDYVNDKLQSPA